MIEYSKSMNMSDDEQFTFEVITYSPDKTEQLGKHIGENISSGDILCFSGTLGAGKTNLARGVALGWGTTDQPGSPTFGLVNEYSRGRDDELIFHIDCYRLSGMEDALSIGISDILDSSEIIIVEWPERIKEVLPEDVLWVSIEVYSENQRHIHFRAHGDQSQRLLEAIKSGLHSF